jgi:hypothetical protein
MAHRGEFYTEHNALLAPHSITSSELAFRKLSMRTDDGENLGATRLVGAASRLP